MAIKISGSTIIDDNRNIVSGAAATFTSNVSTDSVAGTILASTNTAATQKVFARDVKQIFMDTSASGAIDYTADLSLTEDKTLAGQVSWSTGTSVTGLNTDFESDLVVGDIVAFPSGAAGALEERRIDAIGSATTLTISAVLSNAVTNVNATRKRVKFQDEEEVVLVYKMPEDSVKTLLNSGGTTDTSFIFRKQINNIRSHHLKILIIPLFISDYVVFS